MEYWNLLPTEGKRVIILVVLIPVELLIYCLVSNKYEKRSSKWHIVISIFEQIVFIYVLSFTDIKRILDIIKDVFSVILPNWRNLSLTKFITLLILEALFVWRGIDALCNKIKEKTLPLFEELQQTMVQKDDKKRKEILEKYKEKTIQDVYLYFTNGIIANNKESERLKSAIKWYKDCSGKETATILNKILKLANGIDGEKIEISSKGEQRLLFMTGFFYDDKDTKALHYRANQKALQRFEEFKNRGFVSGKIDEFCITLQGKEYILEKNAINSLPPKRDSNEQNNTGKPLK